MGGGGRVEAGGKLEMEGCCERPGEMGEVGGDDGNGDGDREGDGEGPREVWGWRDKEGRDANVY